MRITRETLIKTAKETASHYARQDKSLVCIYLTGSILLEEDPLLGNTGDVDLVMVHDAEQPYPRELVRLTEDVHLDIAHYYQGIFARPRNLRQDPWVGSFLCEDPVCLYDLQHWFELKQASVAAQFNLPETVLSRCRPMSEAARKIWMDINQEEIKPIPVVILKYLQALELAANSIACLSGPALTERRFLINFPKRAEAVERPGLASGLVDLLSRQVLSEENWKSYFPDWQESLTTASKTKKHSVKLDACRLAYYIKAAAGNPSIAPWLVLRTWALAENTLGSESRTAERWMDLCNSVGLGEESFFHQLSALDAYLDGVEETLDIWASKFGV